jgi:hypothetical protein
MRSGLAEPYLRRGLADAGSDPDPGATNDLAVWVAHLIAEAVMNVAGPLFWAVLIVGFMAAEFRINLFR